MTIQNVLSPTGALGGEFTSQSVGLGNVDNTHDMDKPVSTPQQAVLDTKLNITDALSNTVAPITFYFEDNTYPVPIDLVYTDGLLLSPSTKAEYIDVITVNNNSVKVGSYVSIPLGISNLLAGSYEYNYWAIVSAATGTTTLSFKWYKHTVAEVSTLMFTHTTPDIEDLTYTLRTLVITQPTDIIVEPTDRIIVEIWATTTNVGNINVSFSHQGSLKNSSVITPITSSITNVVQTALDLKQDRIDRDLVDGFVGLTALKVNMRNVANTHTSYLTNVNTDSRTYTFPDKNCTLADAADITGTNSGINTGDQHSDGTSISGVGSIADPFRAVGVVPNSAIVAATKTKITYDAKGLVTVGADATTADIASSTNKRYLTDAQLVVVGNTSGTNSGDNAVNSNYSSLVSNVTHTGEVTGATALTIAAKAVTLAKMNDLTTSTIIGRVSGTTGVPEALTAANVRTIINVADGANVGVVPNVAITGATKTKITYDAKGLVTVGADATTADIASSTDKRYLTDAQLVVVGNTSGTNSGDNATNSQYSPLLLAALVTVGGDGTLTNERALSGTSNQISLTDGGANGSVTLAIAANAILPGTGAVTLPTGTTLQTPAGVAGMMRENSITNMIEAFNNGYWSRLGLIKQHITGSIAQAAPGATQIPFDTSIPLVSEGTQIWTQSITPLSATNKVIVRFSIMVDCATSARGIAVSLFRDSTCIGVHAATISTTNLGQTISFNEVDVPGVTTATVYSARIGSSGSGNVFVNKLSTATFGGTVTSSYTLEEIVA